MQIVIVIFIILACFAYSARQLLKTLRAGNGKAGACCSSGCGGDTRPAATDTPSGPRVQFIPSDSLRRKRVS